jgi:hypothetical protein
VALPFENNTSTPLPKFTGNRKSRRALAKAAPTRSAGLRSTTINYLLDPIEPRILLSADPMAMAVFLNNNPGEDHVAATIRLFSGSHNFGPNVHQYEVRDTSTNAILVEATEITSNVGLKFSSGSGNDAISLEFEDSFSYGPTFEVSVDGKTGTDSVEITSFMVGYTGDINLKAESISVDAGVSIGTELYKVGKVTLDADAAFTGSGVISDETMQASVTLLGSVISGDVVKISADAVTTASQTSYVLGLAGFDMTADADVTIGATSIVKGTAVSITANADSNINVSAEFAIAAIAISDAVATADVLVASGAIITAGSGDLDATMDGYQSLWVNAEANTNIDVALLTPSTFFSDIIDNTPLADIRGVEAATKSLVGFDMLISTVNAERSANVTLGDVASELVTISAAGLAGFHATAGGVINNIVKSEVVGVAVTDIARDVAQVHFVGAAVVAGGIDSSARGTGETTVLGKVATLTNPIGTFKVSVDGTSDLDANDIAGLSVLAQDLATFATTAESVVLNPGSFTPVPGGLAKVQLGYTFALNILDRDTLVDVAVGARLTAEAGNLSLRVSSDVQALVVSEKMQSSRATGVPFMASSAYSFGGNLAVNEMNGDVKVNIVGADLSAKTITIAADNDAIFSSISESGTSLTGASGGAVGVSIALNVLGHKMTDVGGYFGLALDTLIGLPLGVTLAGYGAEIDVSNTGIISTGKTSIKTNNTLVATTFTTNVVSSNNNSSFSDSEGGSIAFVLANNKIASKSKIKLDGNTDVGGKRTLSAGSLDVLAVDHQQIATKSIVGSDSVTSTDYGLGLVDKVVTGIASFIEADYWTDGIDGFEQLFGSHILVKTASSSVDLSFGDKIYLLSDYAETDTGKGAATTMYKFMVDTDTGPIPIDLANEDFSDKSRWRAELATEVVPTGLNFTNSDSTAFGGMLVRNEVRTEAKAEIINTVITVNVGDVMVKATENTEVTAIGDLGISSSGGSSLNGKGSSVAVGGALVINTVLGDAEASLTNVTGMVAGHLSVLAISNISLDATLHSYMTTGSEAKLFNVAFNTLGYEAGNLAFQTLDALIGLEIGSKDAAITTASITGGGLTAKSVTVKAEHAASLSSKIDSNASSAAAAAYGASGQVISGNLVSNALVGGATAFIMDAASGSPICATAGEIRVEADDVASLTSTNALIAAQSLKNDLLSGVVNSVAQKLLDSYKYTDTSGTQDMVFGDTVYVDGVIYKYMGDGPDDIDLGVAIYTNLDLWKVMSATTIIPTSIAKVISKVAGLKGGTSKSLFGLIARNEVEGGAFAYVENATLIAEGDIDVRARERATLNAVEASSVSAGVSKSFVIATNSVLSKAEAHVKNSSLRANDAGNDDTHSITIEAYNLVTANTDVSLTSAATADGLGLLFAFNTVGYDAHNVFFQTAEALIGNDYLTPLVSDINKYGATAYAEDSDLIADQDVIVQAESREFQGQLPTAVSAQDLNDVSRIAGDDGDADQDAVIAATLKAELINLGLIDGVVDAAAEPQLTLTVETLAESAQWYIIASDGTIWNVLAEKGAGETVVLNVYLANILNARVGNEQIVEAKNDRVFVDRFIDQKKFDKDEAAAKEKGEDFKEKFKYGSNAASAGGVLASNKVHSETRAWIHGSATRYDSTQTVTELRTGDVVGVDGRRYSYTGNQVRATDYNHLSIATPTVLATGDKVLISATFESTDATKTFKAGETYVYSGGEQNDVAGLDLEALFEAKPSDFTLTNVALSIDLSAENYPSAEWTYLGTATALEVTATHGFVKVSAIDTANLRVSSSLTVSAEATNNVDAFKAIAAQLTKDGYDFTTSSGVQDIGFGDVVRIGVGGPDPTYEGKFYRYLGGNVGGTVNSTSIEDQDTTVSIDLNNLVATAAVADGGAANGENLSNTLLWEEISDNTDVSDLLFPNVGNLSDSDSRAMGGIIVFNDVEGGTKADILLMNVSGDAGVVVHADANATMLANLMSEVVSSGGSAWGSGDSVARSGVIATNVIRNSATAEIVDSIVAATNGVVNVEAYQSTVLDASLDSNGQTGDTVEMVTLAFNSLGYKASNILFDAAAAFATDPSFNRLVPNDAAASAIARIVNSTVTNSKGVIVNADSRELLNSTVSNTAVSAAGALTGANGEALNLVIASNKVLGEAKAYIDNSGLMASKLVDANGNITVTASDKQRLFANVKLVANSSTTNDGGAAVLQETLNDLTEVDWAMSGNSQPVALRFGHLVRVDDGRADVGGKILEYMGPSDPFGGANVFDASGKTTIVETDDFVRVVQPDGSNKYFKYSGATLQDLVNSVALTNGVNLGLLDFSTAPDGWTEVTANAQGIPYSGVIDLNETDLTNADYWKESPSSKLIPQGLNLPSKASGSEEADSDSRALGALFVYNELQGGSEAYVKNASLRADDDVTIRARQDSELNATTDVAVSSSGGTVIGTGTSQAISGVVATNLLTGSATAYVKDAMITAKDSTGLDTTGSILVEAVNAAKMTAKTAANVATGDTGVNVVLAFNSMGYAPTNVLFNTFNALVGDPNATDPIFDAENPVEAHAYLENVKANAADSITVTATNESTLIGEVTNETTSAASAFIDASGTGVGAVLSMNKVLSGAKAEVKGYIAQADGGTKDIALGDLVIADDGKVYERTGAEIPTQLMSSLTFTTGWTEKINGLAAINDLDAGRAIIVRASDDSIVDVDNKMVVATTVTNDGGLSIITGVLENLFADYTYTTLSGAQKILEGQQVLIGSNFAALGSALAASDEGKRFMYLGGLANDNLPMDLATVDFTDEKWQEIKVDDIESLIPSGINLSVTSSDATAVGALLSVNDLRASVAAHLSGADVDVVDGFVFVSAVENALMDALNSGTVTSDGGSIFAGPSKVISINVNLATNNVTSTSEALVTDANITALNPNAADDNTQQLTLGGRTTTLVTTIPLDGTVTVRSDNTAQMRAKLNTTTIAEGGGGTNVAVGASIAFNSVGIDSQNMLYNLADTFVGTAVATLVPSTGAARVSRSTITADDGVAVDANNTTIIEAEIVNAAVATGVSLKEKTTTISIGAIIALNRTASLTEASVLKSSIVTETRGDIKVTADDLSGISSKVTATSVSVAVGKGGSKSVSMSASFARNEITSNAAATIADSIVIAGNDLSVIAKRNADITVQGLSAAIALVVTIGSGSSVSFSGGGAVAFNSVLGQAVARATNSTLNAGNEIAIDATSESRIDATVLAAAASVALSIGGNAPSVGIGVVYVDNMIGYTQTDPELSSATPLTTDDGRTRISNGTIVQGVGGSAITGQTYRYIGNTDRMVQDDKGDEIDSGVDLALEDYSDTNLWERMDLVRTGGASALASADNVDIADTSTASLSVTALASQTINATAAAAAVALAGSTKNAIGFAAGGSAARNRIAGGAIAEVTGSGSDITVTNAEILARDASTINSLVGAAAVSAAISGKTALSMSIGIALAFNEVANEVVARIVGANLTATGELGVKVEAITAAPEPFTIASGGLVIAGNLDDLAQEEVDKDGNDINSDAEEDDNVLTALVGLIDAEVAGDNIGETVGNLSELVFTEAEDANGWTLIDGLGRKFSIATGAGNTFEVTVGTINAVSGAAAFSFAAGKTGIAIAGAGAYSENVVQSKTSAYIDAATVAASGGNVDIDAISKSGINAITVAAAMSVGLGKTGVGVSLGAAISQNLIGREARGVGDVIGTFAYIKDSKVTALDDVSVDALSDQKINALNVAGSVAIAGGKVGVAISGSGVYVRNVIDTETSAKIRGDVEDAGAVDVLAKNVTVKAQNKSDINVIAATVSVSAAFGKTALSVAMGATVAENQIFGLTTAQIIDVNDGGVQATTGNVLVEANDMARINAVAAAGALALAGGASGIGVALAGALAFNRIGAGVSATIEKSLVIAGNNVSILATADGRINALNGAVSAAIGVGGTGVGVAIGAAYISNQIGYGKGTLDAELNTTDNSGPLTTGAIASDTTARAGTTVRVDSGINAGRMFQYIGSDDYVSNMDTNVDKKFTASDQIYLSAIDYNNPEQWVEVNLDKTGALITAGIRSSTIKASGDVLVDAQSNQKINAASLAVAVAIAAGGTGVGISASGAMVQNRIASNPLAFISGGSVTGSTVTVQADDESTINAASIAGAVSFAAGGTGVAIALGVSIADNTVANIVTAKIDASATVRAFYSVLVRAGAGTSNADNTLTGMPSAAQLDNATGTELKVVNDVEQAVQADVDADNIVLGNLKTALEQHYTVEGKLRISAIKEGSYWVVVDSAGTTWNVRLVEGVFKAERATISAIVGAVSVAAGFGGTGVAIAGAGAFGANTVLTNVDAHIAGASVTADAGNIKVLADSQSVINAAVLATSLAVAAGSTGVGIAIGVSVARNFIGESGSSITGQTKAYISNSTIDASGQLIVKATSDKAINALVFAGAAAASAGGVGVSVAGTGVYAENTIAGATTANIAVGNTNVQGGTVTVQALDTSRIEAIAAAVSLTLGIGGLGVSISIAASVAENAIGTTIRASVTETAGGAGSLIATGGTTVLDAGGNNITGNVLVDAQDNAVIRVISAAAAIALAGGISTGVAVSGAGALAFNRITNKVTSEVIGATINAATATGLVPSPYQVQATTAPGSVIFDDSGNLLPVYAGALTVARDPATGGTTVLDAGGNNITGNVLVDAQDNAAIRVISAAAAIALAGGISGGVAVSGAGALAFNRITKCKPPQRLAA